MCKPHNTQRLLLYHEPSNSSIDPYAKKEPDFSWDVPIDILKSILQGRTACIGKCRSKGFGALPNKHFATQKVFLYRRKHCLLALPTIKLPFQSSRVIFLGRSPAEEHLPGIIQAKECMKKKKHISEEQHYLCEIGLEKMPYGSSWLYKSHTEESLTHITITAAPCKVPALP